MPGIVLNEWLFHDLRGENGVPAQESAGAFLLALRQRPDHIVVLRNSPWHRKAFELIEVGSPPVQILSKLLHLGILIDPMKCRHVEGDEIQPLPLDMAREVPDDDVYLFQAAFAGSARLIVTSDEKLIARVTTAHDRGIQMRLRNDFVEEYLALR